MGFHGLEPFETAKASYIWTGLEEPGFFHIEVAGHAPKFSYGFQLVRDTHFVGGLKIDVMGWTGPLSKGTTPYQVSGTFPGEFRKEIVVAGSDGSKLVKVSEVPHSDVEKWLKSKAA